MSLNPLSRSKWNKVKAAHLLNRAGFGGAPHEIEKLTAMGLEGAVDYLVDYEKVPARHEPPSWMNPAEVFHPNRRDGLKFKDLSEEARRERQRKIQKDERNKLTELRGWWLERMRTSPRPLEEKLTLFWHGHFATSAQKVRATYALYKQNEIFRKHAHGNWRDLVLAIVRDPAMLRYLDNERSTKKAPNENLARELMELFTLGIGNYTEEDIKEAARALTGWSIHQEKIAFEYRARMHDMGPKRFLGKKGNLDGMHIVDVILEQPAASTWITGKLWEFFAYEEPEPDLVQALGRTFRGSGYTFKPVLKKLFMSQAFYSKEAMHTQIKSPVQWLVSSAKILEAPLPPTRQCEQGLRALGQELFAPPNVKGWDGGYTWISSSTLMNRYNLAKRLVFARQEKDSPPADNEMMNGSSSKRPEMITRYDESARRRKERQNRTDLVDVQALLASTHLENEEELLRDLEWRFFQRSLRKKDLDLFREHVRGLSNGRTPNVNQLKQIVHAVMCTPQYQLC